MNSSEIPKILESLKINPDDISNKKDAETFRILLKIIEHLSMEVNALKAELQNWIGVNKISADRRYWC
jgi:hypothetical protein